MGGHYDADAAASALAAALRGTAVAVCLTEGPEHVVSWAGERLAAVAGRPLERVIGARIADLLPQAASAFDRAWSSGTPLPFRERLGGGAAARWFEGALQPRTAERPVTGLLLVAIDVTDQAAREQERADLLSLVTHDLGNPLFAVTVAIQLALRRLPPDAAQAREALQRAETQTTRMGRLVRDLSEIGRADAALSPLRERVDLGAVVRASVEQRSSPRITVRADADVHVDADRARIGELIDHLIANALAFSPPESPVTIVVRREADEARVTIADRGPGVPEADRERIFEAYFRSEAARAVEGSGIGLYIARLIATRHGGRIWLEESGPAGSRFALGLPLAG